MIDIKIENNSSAILSILKGFPEAAKRSTARALKRSEKGVITDLSRFIPDEYNITSGKIRRNINVKFDKQSSVITVLGAPLSLTNFTRARVVKRRPVGGVSVTVKKTKKIVKGSFAAKMHNGQIHIFKRTANTRLPIKKLVSVSVPQMVNKDITEKIVKGANSRFLKSLNHEINRFLK